MASGSTELGIDRAIHDRHGGAHQSAGDGRGHGSGRSQRAGADGGHRRRKSCPPSISEKSAARSHNPPRSPSRAVENARRTDTIVRALADGGAADRARSGADFEYCGTDQSARAQRHHRSRPRAAKPAALRGRGSRVSVSQARPRRPPRRSGLASPRSRERDQEAVEAIQRHHRHDRGSQRDCDDDRFRDRGTRCGHRGDRAQRHADGAGDAGGHGRILAASARRPMKPVAPPASFLTAASISQAGRATVRRGQRLPGRRCARLRRTPSRRSVVGRKFDRVVWLAGTEFKDLSRPAHSDIGLTRSTGCPSVPTTS
mgnify:CR=1 FL=1